MLEEVFVHEAVVGLWVGGEEGEVFVHVEGVDVREGEETVAVEGDEVLIDFERGGAGGEAQDEGAGDGGGEGGDAVENVVGCP